MLLLAVLVYLYIVPVTDLRGWQAKKPLRTICNSTLFSTSLRLQLS